MSTKTGAEEKRAAVEYLEFNVRTGQRVAAESWSFRIAGRNQIEICNESYGFESEDHVYIVTVGDREGIVVPESCTCPAFAHYPGACKHMVSCATVAGPTVLNAAAEFEEPAGGVLVEDKSEEDACPNGDPKCDGPDGEGLPCWPCYQGASENSKACPKCDSGLESGELLDCVTGQRGWACEDCDVVYSPLEVNARTPHRSRTPN